MFERKLKPDGVNTNYGYRTDTGILKCIKKYNLYHGSIRIYASDEGRNKWWFLKEALNK